MKLIISKFLSFLNDFEENSSLFMEKSLKMIISNHKQQIRNIRTTMSYLVNNEKYTLNSLKIIKDSSKAKIFITLNHSFTLKYQQEKTSSIEIIKIILLLEKKYFKWKIFNLINFEICPSLYEQVKKNKDFYPKLPSVTPLKSSSNNLLRKIKEPLITHRYKSNTFNVDNALSYALKHALIYNDDYDSFDNKGGDCTNFVSQCIHAGGINTTSLWKPYSHSWIRVNDLYKYFINSNLAKDTTQNSYYEEGSIVQFYSKEKGYYSHSGIITKSLGYGEYLYTCHSYDKLNFPLSEVYPYIYPTIRIFTIK